MSISDTVSGLTAVAGVVAIRGGGVDPPPTVVPRPARPRHVRRPRLAAVSAPVAGRALRGRRQQLHGAVRPDGAGLQVVARAPGAEPPRGTLARVRLVDAVETCGARVAQWRHRVVHVRTYKRCATRCPIRFCDWHSVNNYSLELYEIIHVILYRISLMLLVNKNKIEKYF